MRIYLAGPLFTVAEIYWNSQLALAFRRRCTADLAVPQDFCKGATNMRLVMQKCTDELTSSDVVVVNADGPDIDSGTAFEAGMAYALGIKLVVYRTDFRRAGDCDLDCNLMIAYAGTFLSCQGDSVDTIASKVLKEIGY